MGRAIAGVYRAGTFYRHADLRPSTFPGVHFCRCSWPLAALGSIRARRKFPALPFEPRKIKSTATALPRPDPAILPVALTRFFGRETEIVRLLEMVSDPQGPRLITLTGMGGTGKTRLVVAAAKWLADEFNQQDLVRTPRECLGPAPGLHCHSCGFTLASLSQ